MIDETVNDFCHKLIYPSLVDYDEKFRSTPGATIIPCGTEVIMNNMKLNDIHEQLFKDGTCDLDFVASCECGMLTGNFYENVECPKCHTKVKTNFASELKFRLWFKIPELCTDINSPRYIPPLLHPALYFILKNWMGTKKRVSVLDTLLNPELTLPDELVKVGMGQGYRYFYRNFDDIMNYFLTEYKETTTGVKGRVGEDIKQLIAVYRPILFFRHIPVLNQNLHLQTASGSMKFSDCVVVHILKLTSDLSHLIHQYNTGRTLGSTFIDRMLWLVHESFTNYTDTILKAKLIGKPGYIRQLILGARMHCTARAVIRPLSGEHACDEVHIPWRMGVNLLKLEILNLLTNRYNYTMAEALAKQAKAALAYDPDVDNIMKTLIAECKEISVYVPELGEDIHPKGLPVLIGRNPTMRVGAIMLYFVTRIKTDLNDNTISLSARCASAPNFDFDGDAMHVVAIKEMDMIASLFKIHPSCVMLVRGAPGTSSDVSAKGKGSRLVAWLSEDISITKQEAINFTAWLSDPEQFKVKEKQQ